jgi:hypothetical protein
MSRRIEHRADYSDAPTAVHAAFADPAYWQARIISVGGAGSEINSLDITDSGIEVHLTQAIAEEHLPSIVKKVKSGDLTVQRTEIWEPFDGTAASGAFTAVVAGTPIRMHGTHSLNGSGSSATVQTTGQAQVSVPIIGGKIEQIIADNITRLLSIEQDFTAQWMAEH